MLQYSHPGSPLKNETGHLLLSSSQFYGSSSGQTLTSDKKLRCTFLAPIFVLAPLVEKMGLVIYTEDFTHLLF